MKVLVVGSGGREHALAWCIARSPRVTKVYAAPGNGGTAEVAENVALGVDDIPALVAFAVREDIGLTVVGPEVPLVAGLADALRAAGRRVFGPNAAAARLEGSKLFAKETMVRAGVPTAGYEAFTEADAALGWLAGQAADKPWVVKADGLAAGKGVLICDNRAETEAAVREVMVERAFGAAGDTCLIEERLAGYEVSLLAICAGQEAVPLAPAQDYKRALDGDRGPNTGGMGCYSPVPSFSAELVEFGMEKVIRPVLRQVDFSGVLYAGLMITPGGPQVLEFNVRFGDPETQVVLPRMATDVVDLLTDAADGELGGHSAAWLPDAAVTVVMASGGYPGEYAKGEVIAGLEAANALPGVTVFHAGTERRGDAVVTAGGRVLNVTALGPSFGAAADRAYRAVDMISWPGAQCRRDIAARVRE